MTAPRTDPQSTGPKCDPIQLNDQPLAFKVSSIGDPEWGMYVTPDDPLRDTPEKARVYYVKLFNIIGYSAVATAADLDAAKVLLGA